MPMLPITLQPLLQTAIAAQLAIVFAPATAFPIPAAQQLLLAQALATAISTVIVPYIQTNALVVNTVPGPGIIT